MNFLALLTIVTALCSYANALRSPIASRRVTHAISNSFYRSHICTSSSNSNSRSNSRSLNIFGTRCQNKATALRFKISEDDKLGATSGRGKATVLFEDDEEDEDDEFEGDEDSGAGTGLLRKLSSGMVPLAASMGFAAVPSSRVALRVAGAAAGGIIGSVLRTIIRRRIRTAEVNHRGKFGDLRKAQIDKRVSKALQQMTSDPQLLDMELKALESIAKKQSVPADLLTELFTRMFAEVVYEAVVSSTNSDSASISSSSSLELTELSAVRDFAEDIGLSVHEIGCGFGMAALKLSKQLKRDSRGFYTEDYPLEMPFQAAKIFFLGDKMIGRSDGFYGKKLHTCLSFFVHDDYKSIVTSACTSIFRRYIEGVFLSPGDYSTDLTSNLKEFLATSSGDISGLRSADMQNMVLEAIQFSLDSSLPEGESALDARVDNLKDLQMAQQVLGWNARELAATVELRTAPKYLQAVRELLERVQSDPHCADEYKSTLEERAVAFGLDRSKARDIVMEVISEKNMEYMDRINNVYEASGKQIAPTYKIMVKYAHTHQAFQKLAEGLTSEVKEIPIPGLPFVKGIRASMFQLQLDKGKDVGEISAEMFDLREEQRAVVERQLVLPKVSSWVTQCIQEGNFAEEAKQAYRKQLASFDVSEEEWRASAVDFYYQECSRIAKSRQVPTSADMQRLEDMKKFLDCDSSAVDRVNLELLGDKYVKAVTEAMTPTGIITEEYVDGLQRLQQRLGLTDEHAMTLFGVATQSRIAPAVSKLVDVWKSDTDASYRREKERKEAEDKQAATAGRVGSGSTRDKSRDNIDSLDNVFGYMEVGAQKEGGGPNVFMRDALNMVDIVVENFQMLGISDSNSIAVNAVDVAPPADLAGVFKHFLITRLAEQDAQLRQRYMDYELMFAKILGIDEKNQQRVKQSLAYTAYKNMLRNILRVKPLVEAKDIQQFLVLKQFLPLEEDIAEKIRMDASKHAAMEHAEILFGGGAGRAPDLSRITPSSTRTFREQLESLDLNMREDAGFTPDLLTYMYALEVQGLVESGEGEEILSEINELSSDVYSIPEERAQAIIQSSCERYMDQLLNLALSEARNYKEEEALKYIKQMIKNANFISGPVMCDANMFTVEDKERLLSFYMAELDSGEDEELLQLTEKFGNMEQRFREMIQLRSDYEGPEYGLEGLKGKIGDLAALQVEKSAKMAAGEKEWTWS